MMPTNSDWKRWKATFRDYIAETYCHGVDVLSWFPGGHPASAFATGVQAVDRRGDMRDHCTATFNHKNNVRATLTGSQVAAVFHRDVHESFYGRTGPSKRRASTGSTNARRTKRPGSRGRTTLRWTL